MTLFDQIAGARVFDLEQPRFAGMPMHPAHKPGYFYALHRRHRDSYRPDKYGPRTGASGVLTMMEHSGTHMDALCHQACGPDSSTAASRSTMSSAPTASRRSAPRRCGRCSAAACCSTWPAGRAVDLLPPHYAITADDFEACARAAGSRRAAGRRAVRAHRLRRALERRSGLPERRRRVEVGQHLGGGAGRRRGRRRQHGVGLDGRSAIPRRT